MAERVIGVGLPVAISGLEVSFAGDDLDGVYYNALTVFHYIYNITRNDTRLITSKRGTEAGGYTFGVAAAPGWASGDFCVPCMTNDRLTYASLALAIAAAVAGDRFLLTYSNAANLAVSFVRSDFAAKSISIWGMLARQRSAIIGNSASPCINFQGDMTGQANVVVQNLTTFAGQYGVNYNDTGAALTGGGYTLDRAILVGAYSTGARVIRSANNACIIQRVMAEGCTNGVVVLVPAIIRHVTTFNCGVGITNSNVASTITNVAALNSYTFGFIQLVTATVTYCASSDATADDVGGAGNIINQTRAMLDLWEDNDNHYYVSGGRILTTSSLCGAGNAIAGLATDIDGNDISVLVPIGAHKGTFRAYAQVAARSIRVFDNVGVED